MLEVGFGGALGEPVGDRSVARSGAGGRDDRRSGAADHARPEEGQPGPILVLPRIQIARHGVLQRRRRLAGERRLIDEQVVAVEQARVRRDDVARAQDHHVAAHDVVDRDILLLAVPDHCGAQSQTGLQRGHGRLGAGLLDEAQKRAHHDDGQNDAGLDPIADGQADHAGGDEDQDQRAGELADQDGQRPAAALAAQRVGAVLAKSLGRFGRGQAARCCRVDWRIRRCLRCRRLGGHVAPMLGR